MNVAATQEYYASIVSLYDSETASRGDLTFWTTVAERWRPHATLEYGCGSGRVAVPMALRASQWGGRVVGLDLSGAMLQLARRRWKRERREAPPQALTLLRGDMRSNTCGQEVDLVVFADDPLTHLESDRDLAETFKRVREQLRPGGRLVIEASLVPPEARQRREVVTTWSDDFFESSSGPVRIEQERLIMSSGHRAHVRCRYTTRNGHEVAPLEACYEARYLELVDVRNLFDLAGCGLEERWEDFDFRPLSGAAGMGVFTGTRR